MELLAFVFLWPLIILVVGVLFISAYDLGGGYLIGAVFLFLFALGLRGRVSEGGAKSEAEDLETYRRATITFSIALLIPIFVRYLLFAFENSLPVVVGGLALGFGITVWGMFVKGNKVLMYGNAVGGALTVIYVYSQLWHLGELPRIIAAGFGLALAVAVSIVKFREKLQ